MDLAVDPEGGAIFLAPDHHDRQFYLGAVGVLSYGNAKKDLFPSGDLSVKYLHIPAPFCLAIGMSAPPPEGRGGAKERSTQGYIMPISL